MEGDRATGPFSALWFLLFVMPLFLFTPDVTRSALSLREAAKKGLAQVSSTIADARRHHSVGRFLLANMVYQDALVALFAFGASTAPACSAGRRRSSASSASC